MQNQRGFVGVLIMIVLGLIVVGGGSYFVMQQKTPSHAAPKNWKVYKNSESPIIFSHPDGWQCSTDRSGSPWQQERLMLPAGTTCYSGTAEELPLFTISSPFTGESPTAKSSNFTTLRTSIVTAQNAQSVQKTVYVLSSSGGAAGTVEYVLTTSAYSYFAAAIYDSRDSSSSYKRAEDVENVLDTVIKTISAR